jgi:hypothetical protein
MQRALERGTKKAAVAASVLLGSAGIGSLMYSGTASAESMGNGSLQLGGTNSAGATITDGTAFGPSGSAGLNCFDRSGILTNGMELAFSLLNSDSVATEDNTVSVDSASQ